MKPLARYLRFTDPIWHLARRVARRPEAAPAGRQGLTEIAVALLLAFGVLAGSLSVVTPQSGETPPRFANYMPHSPLGRGAGEPSIGVNWNTGKVMYIAGLETLRVTFDDCTSPASGVWEDVSPSTTPPTTLDPILFTDSETGRTFSSQLAGKTSVMSFTDDDGETWTQSQGGGINSGVDHQTVGSGPYPDPLPPGVLGPISPYPHAVYYCSQDVAMAQCARSDDGGQTFGPAVPIYAITECGGLHGHVKVAPDGTAYVPNPSCNRGLNPLAAGEPGIVRSTDAGTTWTVRTVQGANTTGSSDPSIGIASNGTIYFGYEDQGHAAVAVSGDRGDNWTNIRDVSTSAGLHHIVFPQVTAGDPDRAAIAFLGTDYNGPGNVEGDDPLLPVVWYQYVAMTYDGGNTWVTTNATPGDPVQRGTICGAGPTCGSTRNLLDFNDITVDVEGRILAAYADGCIGGCVNGPPNSGTDVAKIARQVSGRRLFAAGDVTGPPAAVLLQAFLDPGRVVLSWEEPDDHGTPIASYRIYRRTGSGPQALLATTDASMRSYSDAMIVAGETYSYEVTAVNMNGVEGARCREVVPVLRPQVNPCVLPGITVTTDEPGDATTAALDIASISIAEPFSAADPVADKLVFTLKVAGDLTLLQPGNAWVILWNRPIPDADFDRNFIVMRAITPTMASFRYGKVSPPSVNQAVEFGDADSGSYTPDGRITITISADKVDGVAEGQDLNSIEARTFVANVNMQPITQASSADFSAAGFYTRAGNLSCNPAPVARDDAATTPENQPVVIAVLANDTDATGDPLILGTVTPPANGSAQGNADGTVTYTPQTDFAGTDTFTYSVSDPGGLSDTASVTVIVFRAPPFQNPIQDDAFPDQVDGKDKDGNYKLSWTFPALPDSQPCMFQVEEARSFVPVFSDDAEEPLLLGQNTRWSGDLNWASNLHPDTGTPGYSVVYTDEINASLTMQNPVAMPVGPTRTFLFFDSFEDIENDFDYAFVEASVNGGPFQALFSSTGQFSGTRVIDLSDFAGSAVRIRFRFDSDMLVSAPLFLGWFIDNVEIRTADFATIGTVSGATYAFDVLNNPSGLYLYRIAGLFAAGCVALGPYSNLREITVERADQPQPTAPIADFTATPNPGTVNQAVTFDARASRDTDGVGPPPPIVRYVWSFGDGTTQTTTNPVTAHSYGATGTYRVLLTVTDNDDQSASTEQFVEVVGQPLPGEKSATGGGWIARAGGGRANFGFNVKKLGTGAPSGHLNYHDGAGKTKVSSDSISSLVVTGNKATFSGACSINKKSGFSFTVEVVDDGEPGMSDTFMIRLSNGYQEGGTLGGGNIQVRK